MELEWDERKRRSNREKHGLDFQSVQELDWDNAILVQDQRRSYSEPRYWAFAMHAGRLYFVVLPARRKGSYHQLPKRKQQRTEALWREKRQDLITTSRK